MWLLYLDMCRGAGPFCKIAIWAWSLWRSCWKPLQLLRPCMIPSGFGSPQSQMSFSPSHYYRWDFTDLLLKVLWKCNFMYYFFSWPYPYKYCGVLTYSRCTRLKQLFLPPPVLHQVYQRSTPRNSCWFETYICRDFPEPVGSQQPAHVEAYAVQCGISTHCCAGTVHLRLIK